MLGVLNVFVKPVLKILTIPLRILTLGLFSIVINMFIVWLVDVFFGDAVEIIGLFPLFWTSLVISALSILLALFGKGKI